MSSNRETNWNVAQARALGQSANPSSLVRSRERTPAILPFEHNLVFALTGRKGARHEQVLQVSTQGEFVIDTVSYFVDIFTGFIAKGEPPPLIPLTKTVLSLATGEKLEVQTFQDKMRVLGCEFTAETVRFLFRVSDAGSGRQLQNEPLHNVAILGLPGLKLPRALPRPWRFAPRTEVRVEIEELFSVLHERAHFLLSEASRFRRLNPITGRAVTPPTIPIELHITFHGHKILRP